MITTDDKKFVFVADETDKEIAAEKIVLELMTKELVSITGATITGLFDLQYQRVKGEMLLQRCVVSGSLNLGNTTFDRQVILNDSTFAAEGLYYGATFRFYLEMRNSVFEKEANFTLATFEQGVNLAKARFAAGLNLSGVKTDFLQMEEVMVEGDLQCSLLQVMKNIAGNGLKCNGSQVILTGLSVRGDVWLNGAVFKGAVDMGKMKLDGLIDLSKAKFLGPVTADQPTNSFFGSTVKGAVLLTDAVLKEWTTFESLTVGGNFLATGLGCEGPANFSRMELSGVLNLRKAQFHATGTGTDVPNSFFGSLVNGGVFLEEAAFKGRTTFESLTVRGDFHGSGLQFEGPASFSGLKLDGLLDLGKAKFLATGTGSSPVNSFFGGAVKGAAVLTDAVFKGHVSFESFAVQGNLVALRLRCEGPANFSRMRLGGVLRMDAANFLGGRANTDAGTSFDAGVIQGNATFSSAVFTGNTSFRSLTVQGNLRAFRIHCEGPANFTRLQVDGELDLGEGIFAGPVEFEAAVSQGFANLNDSVFQSDLSFTLASFRQGLSLTGAAVALNLTMPVARVSSILSFVELKVKGSVNCFQAEVVGSFDATKLHCGPSPFFRTEITDPLALAKKLLAGTDPVSAFLWDQLPPPAKDWVRQQDSPEPASGKDQTALAKELARHLNMVVFGPSIYDQGRFAGVQLRDETRQLLVPAPPAERSAQCNRLLLEDAYPAELFRNQGWEYAPSYFHYMSVRSAALFFDAFFEADVEFARANIETDAYFTRTRFGGKTSFDQVKIGRTLDLRDCQFLAASPPTGAANSFVRTRIEGDALLSGSWFKGSASFLSLTVLGRMEVSADVPGIEVAARKATRFESDLDFGDAEFMGPFDFAGGCVNGRANFAGTAFRNRAGFYTQFNYVTGNPKDDCRVRFNRTTFDASAVFDSLFKGGIWTFGARFAGYVQFRGQCRIEKHADWQETRFAVIQFEKSDLFAGDVDWRECHYTALQHDGGENGIEGLWALLKANWRTQTQARNQGYKFSVQPYEQLETVCRNQGLDELADEIYYEMRSICHDSEDRPVFRAWDGLECLLFGWGVKPLRMIGAFVLFWALGTLVFCLPGTLAALEPTIPASEVHPSLYASIIVSLCNLVPGLGELKTLDVGPNWSNSLAATCTILQHLFGWMLLALLARQFFAGLSRAGNDSSD